MIRRPPRSTQSRSSAASDVYKRQISYFEAVNKESLSKSHGRSEEEGIIVVARSKESKAPSRVRIDPSWAPSRDSQGRLVVASCKLWELCEKISLSRREGKNRRDGATVQTRVIGLVEMVGAQLWENARISGSGTAGLDVSRKPAVQRRKLQTRPHL